MAEARVIAWLAFHWCFLVIQRRPAKKVADLSGKKAKAHFFKGFTVLKNTAGILNSVVSVFLTIMGLFQFACPFGIYVTFSATLCLPGPAFLSLNNTWIFSFFRTTDCVFYSKHTACHRLKENPCIEICLKCLFQNRKVFCRFKSQSITKLLKMNGRWRLRFSAFYFQLESRLSQALYGISILSKLRLLFLIALCIVEYLSWEAHLKAFQENWLWTEKVLVVRFV